VPVVDAPRVSPARARSFCMNCDAALMGEFCSGCGQRATQYSVSLGVLARDFADEYLSFDSRLFRTVLNLFFRPGFLTRQYLIGRRARYVAPLRLYIVGSLLFFLAFSVVGSGFRINVAPEAEAALRSGAADPAAAHPDSIDARDAAGDLWPALEAIGGSINMAGVQIDVQERVRRVAALGPQGFFDAFRQGFERYLPRMMFLLLPLFALLLKLLYVRRNWFYAEHFIFALHIHAFFFGLFLLLIVTPDGMRGTNLLVLWGMVYLFLAMRHVYRQGWMKTGIKYMMLTGAYSVALALTFVGLLVATVLFV